MKRTYILALAFVSAFTVISVSAKAATKTVLLAQVSLSDKGAKKGASRKISFNNDGTVTYSPGGRTMPADVPVAKIEDKRNVGGNLLVTLDGDFGSIEISNLDHSGNPHFFFTDSSGKKLEMVQSVSYQSVEMDTGN